MTDAAVRPKKPRVMRRERRMLIIVVLSSSRCRFDGRNFVLTVLVRENSWLHGLLINEKLQY